MPKKGDKYIITLGDTFTDVNNNILYRVEGFNSLVFDIYGLDKLEKVYDEPPYDPELDKFCSDRSCYYCPMRQAFPKCGDGMHVCHTTGTENQIAHMIVDLDKSINEARKNKELRQYD